VRLYIKGVDIEYKKYLPLRDVEWQPPFSGEYRFYIENTSIGRDCDYKINVNVYNR
jgi:hypothetical protein